MNDLIWSFRYSAFVRYTNGLGELFKYVGRYCKIEREIVYHFAFHEIHIAKLIKPLTDDGPALLIR